MEMRMFGILLLSGLCDVACISNKYYLCTHSKTWRQAQKHCRMRQGDLATVNDVQDLEELAGLIKESHRVVFLGLRREWGWSLSDDDDYREGEPAYWNWDENEPRRQDCGILVASGKWVTANCSRKLNFFCYDASRADISGRFTLGNGSMNWSDAQAHCRAKHTDLARVRNKHENKEIWHISTNRTAWIGLLRMSWRWSDGSETTFIPWKKAPIQHQDHGDCGALDGSDKIPGIIHVNCTRKAYFFCSRGPLKKLWVRLKLKADDSLVKDPAVAKSLLKMVETRLRNVGMEKDVELSWWKPPEKENEEQVDQEQKVCLFNDSYITFS